MTKAQQDPQQPRPMPRSNDDSSSSCNLSTSSHQQRAAYRTSSTGQADDRIFNEKKNDNMVTMDEAIGRLGSGRFQQIILIAAGLCFSADAMEVTLLSFLSVVLKAEWNLSATQAASITSSVFVGQMLGTITLGYMGDHIGRRPIFLLAATIISVFGVATAFASSYLPLLVTRTIVGFGVGGLVVPFDILAEFLPVQQRGRYLLYVEYFWTAGSMLVPILAYLTLNSAGGSWRWFVFLCALPCIPSAVMGALYVPESPRWLVSQGRLEEAMDILRQAAATNGKDPDVVFPAAVKLNMDGEKESSNFLELLKPKWRRLTLLIWGTWMGFAFGYYGIILLVTRIFHEVEEEVNMDDDGLTVVPSFDFLSIFVSCTAEFAGTSLVVALVDRWGRIGPQTGSFLLGGILLFTLSISYGRTPRAFLAMIAFFARIFEMSASCLTWVTTAEILSTEIRTTGHAAANAVARLSAFVCPFLVEGDNSLVMVGAIMLAIHVFTAACASRLPETKGLALGEISHITSKYPEEASRDEDSDRWMETNQDTSADYSLVGGGAQEMTTRPNPVLT